MLSRLLYFSYKIFKINILQKIIIKLICLLEGGEFYSKTLRKIFHDFHNIDIGMYTHGGCFVPFQFDRHTIIGRYCSIAKIASTMNRNHPMHFKSTHAFFFNPILKYCKEDKIDYTPLNIGNDVWIGHNAIILPHVRNVGDGAVIGAGAVVNKDVQPYAVVIGNPARVVRYRFSKETIEKLLIEKWWEKSIDELRNDFDEYTRPYENKFTSLDERNSGNEI